ncbi:MAG: FAD-dependent oxidoreductase [Armatimonadota bacterium]
MKTDLHHDVVIAGGGLAGVAAALSSARHKAKTLLIEKYGFLGGMGTAGLVNPFMSSATSTGVSLVGGLYTEICDRMRAIGGMLDRAFDAEALKYILQEMIMESGAEMLLHSCVTGTIISDNCISCLEIATKSGLITASADIVVDATGDADVAASAGVPFEFGNPATNLSQAMTLMFTVGGVNLRESLMYAMRNHKEMRFPKPVDEADIDRMLKGAMGVAGFYREVEAGKRAGEFPLDQDMVFFISLPHSGQVVVNTTHISGIDGTRSEDLTKAEIEGRRQVYALMAFMKKYMAGFQNAYLIQTATQIGVRESRRIIGEYVFSVDDVIQGSKFDDCILRSAYPVDIHSSAGKGYSKDEDRLPPVAPPAGDWYEIPYRCIVPLQVDNLLVAGRCVSATHEGQGAVRIMPNCIALGQAAGIASALCVKAGKIPRELEMSSLHNELIDAGAII